MNEPIKNGRIKKLDPYTSNKIAAGEVVERPAAVVKELVENAIDSGATQIAIEIRKAGKEYIRVTDNGSGIYAEDLSLAFERHATSKISEVKDLFAVQSLGFRGEALASIASVSMIELITKTQAQEMGTRVELAGGKLNHTEATGCPQGTTVIVKDLFFNTPARLKFMKANSTETSYITDLVNKLAISHPEIRFKFLIDQKEIFTTPGKNDLLNTVLNIYDKQMVKHLIALDDGDERVKIKGFVSNFEYTRGNRQLQMFFVNGRYIKSKILSDALAISYKSRLPINRFPVCFLMLDIDYSEVDVNIHPAKTEIRFHDEHVIKQSLFQSIKKHLLQYNQVPSVEIRKIEPSIPQDTKPFQSIIKSTNVEKPVVYKPSVTTSADSKSTQVMESRKPYGAPPLKTTPNVHKEAPKVNHEPASESFSKPVKPVPEIAEKVDPFINQYFLKPKTDSESNEQVVMKIQQERKLNEKESPYDDLRIIGQLFQTYILAEKNQQLYMIDQHAAHEKILYEQFSHEYKNAKIIKQILLEPIVIDLNHAQVPLVSGHFSDFEQLGIQMEMFGDKAVIIREVPMLFDRPASKAFAEALMDALAESDLNENIFEYHAERIILESCKKAIKANDSIAYPEIHELIRLLKKLEDPYTCPHGRPIMIQISKHEIERKFKRT